MISTTLFIIVCIFQLSNSQPVDDIKQTGNLLTGTERISKRSINLDDLDLAASTIVFRPYFRSHNRAVRRRRIRSTDALEDVDNTYKNRLQREVNVGDLDTAAQTVFLPTFKRRQYQIRRIPRSIDRVANDIRVERSIAQPSSDLETAANTVFLPKFRRRQYHVQRYRYPRSTDANKDLNRIKRSAPQQSNDLETAANTVFLPKFRRRQYHYQRFPRSINNKDIEAAENNSELRQVRSTADNSEDLDLAANTIVFRPLFRSRRRNQRRSRF